VNVQNPIESAGTSDPFAEPIAFLSSELTGIAAALQTIETRYLDKLQTAAAELRKTLNEEITAEQQRRLDSELQEGLRIVREQFEERFRGAAQDWQAEREKLMIEVESLRQSGNVQEVLKEIGQTESALAELKKEIDSVLDAPDVDLSGIIRKNARLVELRAYLRGLSFRAVSNQNAPSVI
jgi:hypothetical protein